MMHNLVKLSLSRLDAQSYRKLHDVKEASLWMQRLDHSTTQNKRCRCIFRDEESD
ncbi:hypothetical protein PC129_g12758 [Phytophthora cactorum]|uniref:Uncharacterized protein n=1 Tax=Phytophthora cactorum TaxID=29920 RepID=A0A8T1HU17_9STRA|nr:hypothetical protein PC114_g15783 [Phytophthora cactorum]KAG3216374.1 hypothetical protein PC129_g12758 [Phytophthora cactorum]